MFTAAFHTSRHYILFTAMACLCVLLGGPSYAAGAESLIIAGATGHPLRQLERTGIAQALGPNLVPDMEFAMARADIVLAELAEEEKKDKAVLQA